jgi:hypothetical protein
VENRQLPQIAIGSVCFGDFKRLGPIGMEFGLDRGRPIDRYYIENFLARHACNVRGHVLEFQNSNYTKRFGGGRVERCDVLTVETTNQHATIVGDFAREGTLPKAVFDCIIFTQVLQYIYGAPTGLAMLYESLTAIMHDAAHFFSL